MIKLFKTQKFVVLLIQNINAIPKRVIPKGNSFTT